MGRIFNLNDGEIVERMRKDPKFYLESFCKIKTKEDGLQPFLLKPHQLDLFNTIIENPRVICLKGRQMGCSTAIVGLFYHNTIFNAGYNTALIGYNSELAKEFMEKVKTFWRTTPEKLRPTLEYNTKNEITLKKIESKIFLMSASDKVGRGYTLNRCLCVSGNTTVFVPNRKITGEDFMQVEVGTLFHEVLVKDLKPGDFIVNGNCGLSEVKKVLRKKNNKELLKIKTFNGEPLVLTTDHRVLVASTSDDGEWIPARDVTLNSYIAYPKLSPKYHPKNSEYIATDGTYWDRVESISNAESEYWVYDIVLEGAPHSFLTQGGVVHNCSELPFWQDAEEKMQGLQNSVALRGKLVIESTPSSTSNLFYRMWINDKNGYVKKEYGWWWEYTEEEIALRRMEMSDDPLKFAQEYELMFVASGRSVFDTETIQKHKKNQLEIGDVIASDELDGSLHIVEKREDGLMIYRPPKRGGVYILAADTAEGFRDGDYSCAIIIDRKTQEEVAFFRDRVPPDKFADLLNAWGRMYNDALLIAEVNGSGLTTLTVLRNLLYPSLYFRPSKFESITNGAISDKIGWRTTPLSRPLMLDDMRKALREGDVLIHSKEIFQEMSTFIYDDSNSMRAQKGSHDDALIALSIGIQGFKAATADKMTQLDTDRILPQNFFY